MPSLESRIKHQAKVLGFDLAGIATATEADGFDRFKDWLDRGFAGGMDYMERHAQARRHPSSILAGVRSVIMLGLNYFPGTRPSMNPELADNNTPLLGKVARYARGPDYHEVLRSRLNALLQWLEEQIPGCGGRAVVDTAPLLERDFARRAGLGWIGKNTMLINKKLGSYLFLGALLVDQKLEADPSHDAFHCGTCTACLDACPTQAFAGPGRLDARRCISYLTIEAKGQLPENLRDSLHGWVFGCDICQEVCPWNRKTPISNDPNYNTPSSSEALDLMEILCLSEDTFKQRFRRTALYRTKRRGLIRNAALLLGIQRYKPALPLLEKLTTDADPVIRDAAHWAINRILASEIA